jgi:hypothetical protein
MKETIKKLKSLAMLFLSEEQKRIIDNYIVKERWTMLRFYLADLSEEYELKNLVASGDAEQLERWLVVDMMNDIAIELAIQMQKEVDEENKPKKRRKRIIRS